ncbi:MAG: hypothetical protein RLZZ206_1585 [Cyanobacteriota bacterium]
MRVGLLCSLPWLTTSCGWPGSQGSSTELSPPTPPQRPGLERSAPTAALGLQPLPSPQQVTHAVQQGRIDPFSDPRPAPPPRPPAPSVPSSSAGGSRARGVVPAGGAGGAGSKSAAVAPVPKFQLSGVIQSGGRPEAIVVMDSESDSLRIGQRGSLKTPLLPPGWTVESININSCSLVLKKGGQLHTYDCANS